MTREEPGKSLKEQAEQLRRGISPRHKEDRLTEVSQDAHSAHAEKSVPLQRKGEIAMKNSATILGAAAILALGVYFGLRDRSAPPPPPPSTPPVVSTPDPVTINKINIHLDDVRQVVRSIEEAFRRTGRGGQTGYNDIAHHAKELVDLAQKLRSETAPLSRDDSRVIRFLVDRVQHAAHELEDAAEAHKHEESHHSFENLKHEIESLGEEVESLS